MVFDHLVGAGERLIISNLSDGSGYARRDAARRSYLGRIDALDDAYGRTRRQMNNITMAPAVAATSSLQKPYVGICNSSASVLPTKDPAMPTSMFVNIPWRDSTTIP
ncbi:MAG: hypothetical protein ACXWKP_29515, partial [Bradyrhizobium sp.]